MSAQSQHCEGCDGWKGVHLHTPPKRTTTLTPCPGLPGRPASETCTHPRGQLAATVHADEEMILVCFECHRVTERRYCQTAGPTSNEQTPSAPPAADVAGWLRDLIRDLHASLPHDTGKESIDAHLADLRGRCVRALAHGSLADEIPSARPERQARIWGYGCPDHPGDPSAMSGKPSICLARATGIKGHLGAETCGRKLEPLWIGGEERPSRKALIALYAPAEKALSILRDGDYGEDASLRQVIEDLADALARCEREG